MAYPLAMSDLPPLADLSLNDSHRPPSRRPTSHVHSNSTRRILTFPTYQMRGQDPLEHHLSWSNRHQSQWSVPGWQSTLQYASDSIPPLHSNSGFEAPSWGTSMLYPKLTMES